MQTIQMRALRAATTGVRGLGEPSTEANKGNEGDWGRLRARSECGQPKLISVEGAVEWENVRLCSPMFAYVRLAGKKMLRALRATTLGGSEPPNCRLQISDCKLGESEA
jgi:hypothetical protein